MARRRLPRIPGLRGIPSPRAVSRAQRALAVRLAPLVGQGSRIARGRELMRAAADSATDVFHPAITVTRGARRQAAWTRAWWERTPADRRGPLLFLTVAAVLLVGLLPYGPLLTAVVVMGSAAWAGRDRTAEDSGASEPEARKLRSLYEALVPYLSRQDDPEPLYAHGGDWQGAVADHAFEGGRLTRLRLRYPAYFSDGEPEARARIERVLHAKVGHGREYRFDWDPEENRLTLTALPALATVTAQRFVTAPGETILGFTDNGTVQRTIPVADGDRTRDAPPVVWRTGPRSTEPHLLTVGRPGAGTTTLLRSIALQALHHGDVLVIDGGGSGEYAFLAGRPGVLAIESGLAGTASVLEWASHETRRRLIAVNRARQAGRAAPEDVRRPLWIVVDRPTALAQIAAAEDRPDPQELLDVPLRHGRAASVTVAVGDLLDAVGALGAAVTGHTRARVVLGPASPGEVRAVLGAPAQTTPPAQTPPGRGYARLGDDAVHRLQVPATPDPHDEEAAEAHRAAVLALLQR